jgi:hypothetical protein
VRTALFILACNNSSGLVLLSDKIRPRYLNLFTVVIFILLTVRLPLQFMNMASVLPTLISSEFSVQKLLKQFSIHYNSSAEGAIRTTSSANASKNNYNDAIVYAWRFFVLMCFAL